tara:strand:- start:2989 stop:3123 length:135 start_codon:yes stop_codon:yes gene_type:complete
MHFYKWYSHKNDILLFLLAANALVYLLIDSYSQAKKVQLGDEEW